MSHPKFFISSAYNILQYIKVRYLTYLIAKQLEEVKVFPSPHENDKTTSEVVPLCLGCVFRIATLASDYIAFFMIVIYEDAKL